VANFTEREIDFTVARGARLAGTLWSAPGAAGVILAHGYLSDRSSRGRFPALAGALQRRGLSTLAFDFAGCGQSEDSALSTQTMVDDLRGAAAFARALGWPRVALLGHSLGGLICLRAAIPDLAALVLRGAPTGPMRYDWASIHSREQLDELARTGRLTVGRHVVDGQLFRDFADVDAQALLAQVRCPTLLVVGDGDDEERQVLARAREALPLLPQGSRLEVIEGAPHGFGDAWAARVLPLLVEWLVERLCAP
jgi:pimeloyl-ACP methyl ester carboxylesterase